MKKKPLIDQAVKVVCMIVSTAYFLTLDQNERSYIG